MAGGTVAKTLTGARCLLSIDSQPIGLFASVDFGVNNAAEDIYVLGNLGASEIVYTSQDTITVNVSGFRVMGSSPYDASSVPKLQELLTHADITLSIVDRTTKLPVMTLVGVRPIGYNVSAQARGVASLSISFRGLRLSDESDGGSAQGDPGSSPYGA